MIAIPFKIMGYNYWHFHLGMFICIDDDIKMLFLKGQKSLVFNWADFILLLFIILILILNPKAY